MDVEEIHTIVKPLGEKMEMFFPLDESYIDLGCAKNLIVNSTSDIMLKLVLEFSYDGVHKGICLSQRCASMWLSTKHEVPMRYVRFHIVNESTQPNNQLVIACRMIGKRKKKSEPVVEDRGIPEVIEAVKPIIEEVKPIAGEVIKHVSRSGYSHEQPDGRGGRPTVKFDVPVVEEVKKDERGKSPFNRFRKKITPAGPAEGVKKIPLKDCRLPEYAPPGCLLYSTVGNNYKVLPRGLDNEILTMKDGEPTWVMPYPPVKLSEESRRLLAESVDVIPEPWIM